MQPVRAFGGGFNFRGFHLPRVVAFLLALTLGASVLGAVGLRNGFPGLALSGVLVPQLVFSGQLWRLFTWVLFYIPRDSIDGLFFVITLVVLWFISSDIAGRWGPKRFLLVYFGLAAASGTVTCLVSLVWPDLAGASFLNPWAVLDGLIVAWATLFPDRTILVSFVLPLNGSNLVWGTIAGTVLFSLLYGVAGFVPHFAAEALMLVYMREPSLHRLWLRLRLGALQRASRRPSSRLRPVDKDDSKPRWLH